MQASGVGGDTCTQWLNGQSNNLNLNDSGPAANAEVDETRGPNIFSLSFAGASLEPVPAGELTGTSANPYDTANAEPSNAFGAHGMNTTQAGDGASSEQLAEVFLDSTQANYSDFSVPPSQDYIPPSGDGHSATR